MKVYRLMKSQFVPQPLEEVFEFFEKADNLARITPPSMGFEIVTPPPIKMHCGAQIDYVIRILGWSWHWTTLICDYEPPTSFVDVQLKGPYAYWHHRHTFESHEGGTRIMDDVHYALPMGFLGRMVHSLFVKKQLKKIFDYRAKAIEQFFAANSEEVSVNPGLMDRIGG